MAPYVSNEGLFLACQAQRCAIRDRIKSLRKSLVDGIHKRVPGSDFSFIMQQRGMFSYSGLTKEQVVRMREEFAVYAIESGRISR